MVMAALAGAVAMYAVIGGYSGHSGSTLPAQNAAIGLVNSIRVGDPGACEMLTASAQRDLARILGASQARIGNLRRQGLWVCGTVLHSASASTRARAMAPFLGITGIGKDSQSSGSVGPTGDDALEWNQTKSSTYAVILLHLDSVQGWLATAMRIRHTCRSCSS